MDCLERKMDNLHSELGLFKSKCSTLEEQNAGLMSQIKRLQVRGSLHLFSISTVMFINFFAGSSCHWRRCGGGKQWQARERYGHWHRQQEVIL